MSKKRLAGMYLVATERISPETVAFAKPGQGHIGIEVRGISGKYGFQSLDHEVLDCRSTLGRSNLCTPKHVFGQIDGGFHDSNKYCFTANVKKKAQSRAIESGVPGVLVKLDGNDAGSSGGLRGHHGGEGLKKVASYSFA